MIKYVFFDLDGTIVNSSEGIINAYKTALKHFDIEADEKFISDFLIGPPLKLAFIKYFNLDEEKVEEAIKVFRKYYSGKGVNENCLYDGIKELFENLKSKEKTLIIATSKPTIFTEKILERHDVKKYFDFISGATLDDTRIKKGDIIKYAIENMNISNLEECIMVGDKSQDIEGAKQNNMKAIGVTYGFGTKEELETSGATYIVDNVKDINDIL